MPANLPPDPAPRSAEAWDAVKDIEQEMRGVGLNWYEREPGSEFGLYSSETIAEMFRNFANKFMDAVDRARALADAEHRAEVEELQRQHDVEQALLDAQLRAAESVRDSAVRQYQGAERDAATLLRRAEAAEAALSEANRRIKELEALHGQ